MTNAPNSSLTAREGSPGGGTFFAAFHKRPIRFNPKRVGDFVANLKLAARCDKLPALSRFLILQDAAFADGTIGLPKQRQAALDVELVGLDVDDDMEVVMNFFRPTL